MTSLVSRVAGVLAREWGLLSSNDVADFYRHMGFDVMEGLEPTCEDLSTPLWLNFGYWKGVETQDRACRQLADLLAKAANMGPGSRVLDCGFGFAEQDFHWLQTRNPAHIAGINLTPHQVEFAQRRIDARGLQDRMSVQVASATAIPFPDASFDCVVALESAFHFRTRDVFFSEAYRVLKPGGWLATADCLPYPGDPMPPWAPLVLKRFSWPAENCYDRHAYGQRMREHGFGDVGAESIRDYVFPGYRAYSSARRKGAPREARIYVSQSDVDRCRGVLPFRVWTGIGDYVIMRGQKQEGLTPNGERA